jgi:hypothetical protein
MMAKAKDDLLGVCILSARHVANLHPRIILTPYQLLGKSRDYISAIVCHLSLRENSATLVQISFFDSVHPPPLMQRWATALNFVIPRNRLACGNLREQ